MTCNPMCHLGGRGKAISSKAPMPSFHDSDNIGISKLSLGENKENFSDHKTPLENGDLFTDNNKVAPINDTNENGDMHVPIPRVSYIPDDDAEENQLQVNSGINFDNYDSVHVQVTGKDIPPSISSLDDFQIPTFLQANIRAANYKKLTPVQKYTIPIIGSNRDIMACAQTGSGKTVAFLVPIIKAISEAKKNEECTRNAPQCLIMVPTRELCRQIYSVAQRLCRESSLRCGYSYGGVEMRTSMMKLHKCDVLVATPGRLVFNLESGALSMEQLRFLVLDEADRMLQNDAFLEAIKEIYSRTRSCGIERFHVSMFSATFPKEMQLLGESLMVDHLFVAVGMVGAANCDIQQKLIQVTARTKLDAVLNYLSENNTGKTLVFVRAKRFADFLGIRLIDLKFTATTIHGDRDQYSREQALNDFKSGRVSMLVATDVASRGLDIPQVDTVINVDMPDEVDVYVHRIGRTGRCGNTGLSVSFFDEEQDAAMAPKLARIMRDANQECPAWLDQLCAGGLTGGDAFHRRNGESRNRKDYRKNVDVSTFVEDSNASQQRRFMNEADDDFFS